MSDVGKLVREARWWVQARKNGRDWGYPLSLVEILCDALEEREREVARLNRMLESRAITNQTQAKKCTELYAEVERLRKEREEDR